MPQTRRAKQAGSAALDRLRASIEAAETALKDLQGEVSGNTRVLLKDVGKTLNTARRNLNRSRGRIAKDLEQFQHALVKGKTSRPAAKGAPAKRATAKRASAKGAKAKGAKAKGAKGKGATAKRAAAKGATVKRATTKRAKAKRTSGAARASAAGSAKSASPADTAKRGIAS